VYSLVSVENFRFMVVQESSRSVTLTSHHSLIYQYYQFGET